MNSALGLTANEATGRTHRRPRMVTQIPIPCPLSGH